MCYAVPVIVLIDDVSVNHHVVYASNANLPLEMIEKEFLVKFVSLSPHASPIDLAKAVCDSINSAAQNGVDAWDCKYDKELLFGGNNPMQAEECSHNGLGCNLFCQTCKVGGTKAHKASEEGFLELFSLGNMIFMLLTQSIIHSLIEMGKQLRKAQPDNSQASEDAMYKQLDTDLDCLLQPHFSTIFMLPLISYIIQGVNIHMDTPTEILHTVLLGVTVQIIEKAKLIALLEAQILAQVMTFLIHDLAPQDVLDGWNMIGELVAHLSRTIQDLLNITAKCALSILITKPKFHFLVHLPAYNRRFGPAILFLTEHYESFNHVFRLSCIHSNQ
ncbi:hypothetical protein BC835DRAFT_1408857 [Cytidiella melzeri]|nr:hypothetical protein BC835DRAFT_1408857 [Cytidiella melzeri]